MKKKFLLFGAIFMFFGLAANGQVYELYSQGFEGSGSEYTVSPSSNGTVVTELAASGSSSIKLVQQLNTGDVELILDTMDFTTMTQLSYIALEFDHINNCYTNSGGNTDVAEIWFKRASQSNWTRALGSQEYNRADEYSNDFVSVSSFSRNSYSEWKKTTMTNAYWRHERFDLNTVFSNVAAADRKLMIKFVLRATTDSQPKSWWIDNIKVKASPSAMVKPLLKMHLYPDGGAFPNSRGARIELDTRTTVADGICYDSVYVVYTVGSDPTPLTIPMSFIDTNTYYDDNTKWLHFGATIPFEGYDTLMRFHCVVKDNTTNTNDITFPKAADSWMEYWCVRGTERPGTRTEEFVGTSNSTSFLFPDDADGLVQWIFDSAFMADAGYGPGAITDLTFMTGAASQASTRYKFNFRFANSPTSIAVNSENLKYYTDFMHVVLDTTLALPAMSANTEFTIHLGDTFFYSGKDLVMQAIYEGTTVNPPAVSTKMINAPTNKQTLFANDIDAIYDANLYANPLNYPPLCQTKRPAVVLTQSANKPLAYDLGISAVAFPTYDVPLVNQPDTLKALMKNYGVETVNAVRVTWTIDDTIWGYTDWSGAIAGGESITIPIGVINNLPAGYHFLRTWVQDTLTIAGGMLKRDHEPYNDTAITEFIACAGPLAGVRQIGGENADYNNIEEFLFSLSRCGINDSLIVKLAPGEYPPFEMEPVDGLTEQHYIVYESLDPENHAALYADATTNTAQIVDIRAVDNIRFRNLDFVRRDGTLTTMVAMDSTSVNCHFENCLFTDNLDNPPAAMRIASMLNNNYANNMYVEGNTFVGGIVGVTLQGQSSLNRSSGGVVKNNVFRNQNNKAVDVANMNDITIEHNEMNDVLSNNSYLILLTNCYGDISVSANRILTTNGAGAIGINDIHGSQTNHAVVANNMIVCDDAAGNHTLTSPLNIISAEWTDVAYNSIRMTAPSRSNIATATFGGIQISNSRFLNNIVACMDNRNYALSYLPGTQTSNTVGYNVYYTLGTTLNKLSNQGYNNLQLWMQAMPADSMSVSTNPVFVSGTTVDLRTFNRLLKGIGTPLTEVTTDIYDTVRSSTNPCPGAFEFSTLPYDFEIEAMISPVLESCDMPDSVELAVRIRNGGTSLFNPDSTVVLNMSYFINGGATHTFTINDTIPAEDTATIYTGQMLHLPPDGILDGVYNITVWTSCENDPNQTNDTRVFRVVSHYRIPAPADVDTSTLYMTPGVATVEEGVVQWAVYADSAAPTVPSTIYWYHDLDETEPFHVGNTLVTTDLRQDTHFYVKQQREVPAVRFTQVMIKTNNTSYGLTEPLPSWMNNGTKVALQLTNVGDDTAYLAGDTVLVVSNVNTFNGKGTLKFGNNVFIAPGESIVVQYINGSSSNPATVHTGTSISPTPNTALGFIYRHGTVIDAVAINDIISTPSTLNGVKWSTQNVPTYVWNDIDGVQAPTNCTAAGFVRQAFNGNASDWTVSSNAVPVSLGTVNPDWIRYSSNGCDGGAGLVNITISNRPTSDIDLEALAIEGGCGLGEEPLSVRIRNYGDSTVNGLELNYSLGEDTVSETLSAPVVSYGDTVYTFMQSPNLAFATDSNVTIKIWATMVEGDIEHNNDTASFSLVSLFTPAAPVLDDTIEAIYAEQKLVTFEFPNNVMPVWYDYNLNAVDTGYSYLTNALYTNGNIGVSYIAAVDNIINVGTGTSKTAKTNYPSPYQTNKKYSKQQYLYTVQELTAQGLEAGPIKSLAFNFDTITQPQNGSLDSVVFDKYYISIGHTVANTFSTTSSWQPTAQVCEIDSLVLRRTDERSWIWHQFDTPFDWDGTSSIVVQVVHEAYVPNTTGMTAYYTSKANTALSFTSDDSSVVNYTGAGTKNGNRPNIKFNGTILGCNGPLSTVAVKLLNVPDHDATVFWPSGADTTSYLSCGSIVPKVLVQNLGNDSVKGFDLHYWIDDDTVAGITSMTDTILSGEIDTVSLFNLNVLPGRHTVRVVLLADGDTIGENDTSTSILTVRFCSGYYTINADSTGDFSSFGAAVDTLNVVGTNGALVFNVYPGIYNEQVSVNAAPGLTGISFIGQGTTEGEVRIIGNTSVADNYVFKIDGVSNVTIQGLTMEARPQASNVKDANVLMIANGVGIYIQNNRFKVKGSIADAKASCLVLGDSVKSLNISNNIFDSGYCSIKTAGSGYVDMIISDNTMSNFVNKGLDVANVSKLTVEANNIRSGANANSKPLIGVNLAYIDSTLSIYRNRIYLVDIYNGTKRGIHLEQVNCSDEERGMIVNNMIGISGNGNSAAGITPKNPSGIYIDNSSSYINVFYNSVSVNYGTANPDCRAFFSGATNSNLQVVNNIFASFSNNSYAYYVGGANSIIMSDYNGYYSSGSKFAYWGGDKASLTVLQTANQMDENSVQDMPYFTAPDDLHLLMTNFSAKAQSNPDVVIDIDGTSRPPIAPTIGAHELIKYNRNMTVVQVTKPSVPLNLNSPTNIEGDSILVVASFYNNGSSVESDVTWYAFVEGHETDMVSEIKSLGSFNPSDMKVDSVWIPAVLGVIDTQVVRVVVVSAEDEDTSDNELTANVYLAPAFNMEAVKMISGSSGCSLTNDVISITVKNVGFKPIPSGTPLQISYKAQGYHPSFIASNPDSNKIYIPTMPTTPVTETVTFDSQLPKNQTRTFAFTTPANFYPTDTSLNIKVRIVGWFNYQYDIIQNNDTTGTATTASPVVESYYTPNPPVGHDTSFSYGTWGEVTAEQENNLSIRWYRDSTANPFYSPSSYTNSTKWSTTPQYFHDSTYYLQCKSDKNCPSHFSAVHVHVGNRLAHDLAMEEILAPLGGHVYMENDTVRIRIANYGTQSQSNFPVTYAVRKGNNTNPFQTVTETITATIAPNQTYTYTFDSLIMFANSNTSPTVGGSYQVRAWTNLANDQSRRNDTIRTKQQLRSSSNNDTQLDYTFSSKAESTYPSRTNTASDSVDIIRFSFNEIDVDLPALGRSYSNFGIFDNPEIPVLHVTRGLTDSVFMMITNPLDQNAVERGRIAIYIDFNRNGSFTDPGECVVPDTNLWNNRLYRGVISIADDASFGYMKMRVSACRFDKVPTTTLNGQDGHMLDFLLFVDQQAPTRDLSLTQIAEPRDYLIRDGEETKTISFRMANRGAVNISSVDIYYSFTPDSDEDTVVSDTIHWTGNLLPGTSALVSLPEHTFPHGTTTLNIWHSLAGDAVAGNNTLTYEYHRFHTLVLTIDDNFDEFKYWYAPTGNNGYNRNYWECGTPTKTKINGPYSAPNAWVTDLSAPIQSGLRGNISYLYSPIINTAQVRPDTISFRLLRNLTNGSSMRIEYRNYAGEWVNMIHDTVPSPEWYNNTEENRFDGNTPTNSDYVRHFFNATLLSGSYQENFQFRFVYRTPQGANANASYGEGCAIDDLHIGRARKKKDIGVVDITYPETPRYGQTIYPKVVVKNYGSDTIRQMLLGYTHYGTYLAKETTFDNFVLPPDAVDTFLFDSPFIVTSDYPEDFEITAFSIHSEDVYKDNDTTTKSFHLLPLDNDIAAVAIVTPLDRVIAGDSISVTLRVLNFGTSPIRNATLSYIVSGHERVDAQVDFLETLGHPLEYMEYFNYTFTERFRASMGVMQVTGIAKCDTNEYIYNDTVSKRFNGISSIADLAAAAVVLDDTSALISVRVTLVVDNRGARGANGFEVGFWVDDDTAHIYREQYYTATPLPALSRGYHLFDVSLPARATPYDRITSFVHIDDDNDSTNDTTTAIMAPYIDLEAVGIIVEENSAADCRVFVELRNNSNMPIVGRTVQLSVNVNGNDLSYSLNRRIDPMRVTTVELPRRVPKNTTRHYTGSMSFTVAGDSDSTNNQTSAVRVVNYVEGIPTVGDVDKLVLEQNYPNPFSHQTTVPFSLPHAATVRFFVMDATGHIVNSFSGVYPAGPNSLTLDMQAYSAGIYYYGIEVDGQRQMRKMIIR